MGKKDACIWLAVFLLSLPLTVSAQTVDDLYDVYGIDKEVTADESILSTVDSYNNMKKFVAMYNYIDLSTPDMSSQDKQVAELEKRIKDIDTMLFAGYSLTLTEILELEAEQQTASESIERINNTRKYSHVMIDFPDPESVPTYEQFLQAKQELSSFELSKELGDVLGVELPVNDGEIVQHTKVETAIKVPTSSYVMCIFPGEVISAEDGIVEVMSVGDVVISYSNLDYHNVSVGDTVKQYQRIATSTGRLKLSMQIDGEYYDMWRLFD